MPLMISVMIFLSAFIMTVSLVPESTRMFQVQKKDEEKDMTKLFPIILDLSGAVFVFLLISYSLSMVWGLMISPMGLLLARKLPALVNQWKYYFMRKKCLEQLEGACLVISSTVRSGLTLLEAYRSAIGYVHSPLKEELEFIVNEVQFSGKSLSGALKNFSEKWRSPETEILYHATYLASTVGGKEVPNVMQSVSNSIRERKQIDKKIKAKTTYQRISAITISILPIVILMIFKFMAPDLYITLLGEGRIFLIIGIIISCIAWYFIFKIMNFEEF
ncbi:type II secretion system F family protein [Chengkuizengella axinellae]|uniref:Type II secretion system F family protein n=1 Tax=Chengkuizengella axinellae TaxID=3064388 RepID=A0ABT9J4N2_9BACL|nr:type II secretion system F family protein [Chengkuizengella sp. 2205SS18-9]MDP5276563.1 type II secretion system F family protein [Chengkuizengella sp. 2205SS18-9]